MTLNDVYEDWLRRKRWEAKGSSMGTYRRLWSRFMAHELGRRNVEELLPRDWRSLFLRLMDDGLGVPTCKTLNVVCGMVMRYASEEMDLKAVSSWRVKWPKVGCEGRAMEIYTVDESRLLLSRIEEEHAGSGFHLLVALAIYTGMRIGELCALRYSDIDLRRQVVKVERSVSVDEDGKTIVGEPKTASSKREIPIYRDLIPLVEAQARKAPKEAYIARWREGGKMEKLIKPYLTDVWRKRYAHFVVKECGLRYVNPHGLRHGFATTMIEGGADVKTTQTLMGHSNVSTTLNTYCHTTERAKREAIDSTIGAAFGGKKGRESLSFQSFSEKRRKGNK